MSKTSTTAEDDQVLLFKLLQLTMKLGPEDAAAVREAAHRLNALSAALSDLHAGRVPIEPRTRQHALQLYCIAESALRRMQHDDACRLDQAPPESPKEAANTPAPSPGITVEHHKHRAASAQRH